MYVEPPPTHVAAFLLLCGSCQALAASMVIVPTVGTVLAWTCQSCGYFNRWAPYEDPTGGQD